MVHNFDQLAVFFTNTSQQRSKMAENAISERLNLKIFWMGMPPDFPT